VVFKITKYGLGLVALGFGYQFIKKKPAGPSVTDESMAKWEVCLSLN